MHPHTAKTLVAQRHDDIMRDMASIRRSPGRRPIFPRWQVSWSRTVLAPAGAPAAAGRGRAGRAGRRGSSLVIIISAHRSA
jgi:hypothetical protein